jgi:hypothetical protein
VVYDVLRSAATVSGLIVIDPSTTNREEIETHRHDPGKIKQVDFSEHPSQREKDRENG